MQFRITCLQKLVALGLAFAVLGVHAEPPRGGWRQRLERSPRQVQSPAMSLDKAVVEAERRTGGRALSADTRRAEGRRVHRIKVLTPSGRVRILRLEAGGQ